jgi:hypothetical protein
MAAIQYNRLVSSAVAIFCFGWFHYHKAVQNSWFQSVELNHHLFKLLGLGLAWYNNHIVLPINTLQMGKFNSLAKFIAPRFNVKSSNYELIYTPVLQKGYHPFLLRISMIS